VGKSQYTRKYGINNWRIVFLDWRSMVNNVEICRQLGYIKVPETLVRKIDDDVEAMPDDKVMVICTWAQWVIPGNELQARKMINWLLRKWVNVITNNDIDIHASGHWGEDDHKLFLNLISPEYVLPYFMDAYHRYAHKRIAQQMWWSEDKILMPNKNWHIIQMYKDKVVVSEDTIEVKKKIHTLIVDFVKKRYNKYILVDQDIKNILKSIKDELWYYILQNIGRKPMIVMMYVFIKRNNFQVTHNTEAKQESNKPQIVM